MSEINMAAEHFNECYNSLTTTGQAVNFNQLWHNGTGYMNGAADGPHAPKLNMGQMKASTDDNGRRIIIIGTPIGNAVVFERYSTAAGVFVANYATALSDTGIVPSSKIDYDGMMTLLGDSCNRNIGEMLIYIFSTVNSTIGGSIIQKILLENSRSNIHDMDFTVAYTVNGPGVDMVFCGHTPNKGDDTVTLYQVSPEEGDFKFDITWEDWVTLSQGEAVYTKHDAILIDYTRIVPK